MIIRKESEEEFNQIYDLVKIAFQTAQVTNGDEQNFVNKLGANTLILPHVPDNFFPGIFARQIWPGVHVLQLPSRESPVQPAHPTAQRICRSRFA